MRSKATSQFYQEEFQRIGNYKVKGNSYLLKGANVSDLFTTLGFGVNMPLVFDTYTQNVSVMQENKKDIVTLSFEELDSFFVKIDNDKKFTQPVTFINANKIEPGKKMYFQRLADGSKYSLYKSYKADMQRAALDLAQTNVMEFVINSEFYYLPKGATQFVKIKPNLTTLKKQFAAETEALQVLNNTTKENFEENITFFFDLLNSK
ncbi:MAG: hypothetical protein V4651_08635 [Bacteroidota bacterium]